MPLGLEVVMKDFGLLQVAVADQVARLEMQVHY